MTLPASGYQVGVLTYRTKDLVLQNLRTQIRSGISEEALLVWDNQSRDGTAGAVKREFPGVRVVASDRNLGYAAGMNAIVKKLDSRWVVLVTADCAVTRETVEALVRALASEERAVIAGCRILDRRTRRVQSEGGDVTFPLGVPLLRHWNSEPANLDSGPPVAVSYVDGAVLAVDRARFRELGGFDESYFAYHEDVDLCWRARLAGYRVVCVRSVAADHTTSASFSRDNPLRWSLTERNRLATNAKNLEASRLLLSWLAEVPYSMGIAFLAGQVGMPRYRRAYGRAVLEWSARIGPILKERRRVQALRTLPDRDILSGHLRMGWRSLAKALSQRATVAREVPT